MTYKVADLATQPRVSVIIPTYNSENTLDQCLASISKQTYKEIEIIVVDNFSQDKTQEIAKRYNASLFEYHAARSAARNFGFSKSTGRFALFLDSDMELTCDVVSQCIDIMQGNSRIGGVIIPERSVGESFWVKVRNFEKSFYRDTEIESARFFPTELVRSAGGYDEEVIFYEESTLPIKIESRGYSVKQRINGEIYHHEDNFSLRKWLRKKYYYGETAHSYRKKYYAYARRQAGLLFRLKLFLFSRRFYLKISLATSVLFLKFLEFIVAGTGFVIGAIRKQ